MEELAGVGSAVAGTVLAFRGRVVAREGHGAAVEREEGSQVVEGWEAETGGAMVGSWGAA